MLSQQTCGLLVPEIIKENSNSPEIPKEYQWNLVSRCKSATKIQQLLGQKALVTAPA
jgi:hypothetical protein